MWLWFYSTPKIWNNEVLTAVTDTMNKIAFALLTTGLIFLLIQNVFFGYIDTEGIIHDSIFLPLGSISILLSGVILFFSGILSLKNRNRK